MRAQDVLRFVWIADPQISADGRRIAFTHVSVDHEDDAYRTAIWLCEVDVRSSVAGPPRPLTAGPRDSQPRWSPDGTQLAFVRAAEAGKPGQIHLLSLAGGEAEKLTTLAGGVSAPAWSPDGTHLAFLSRTNPAKDSPEPKKPKHEPARVVTRAEFRWNNDTFTDFDHLDHVWLLNVVLARDDARAGAPAAIAIAPDVPAPGPAAEVAGAPPAPVPQAPGAPRQLTTGRFAEGAPRWSRDGKWILFVSDRRPEPWHGLEDSDLFAISPDVETPSDGDRFQIVADVNGPIGPFTESADGRIAAVGGLRDQVLSYYRSQLLLFEGPWPRTRAAVVTEAVDFDFGSDDIAGDMHPPRGGGAKPLAFSADGRAVYGVLCKHGAGLLVKIDCASGAVEELTDSAHEVVAGSATPDARRFALTIGDVTRPGDLCLYDVEHGLVTLWSPNQALLDERGLGEVEEFWCEAQDHTKIHGWIVRPKDFDANRKYPLILQIHGGPHVAYGVGFFHEYRVLAAAGYVVVYVNPRGSTSYGQEFGNIIQYRYPGDDHHDLMAAVDHVIARGYIDESRMGVTGGSGGGLLTNWAIAHTTRFAAAITQRCVADWTSMWFSSDFALFMPNWFRHSPFDCPQEYIERSPVYLAAQIETPLMVIHSEEDWRTPIGQGEAMFRALKSLKKPVVMVRFPGENHELSRSGTPSRRVQNQEHILRWFDHWLMGKPAPEYGL